MKKILINLMVILLCLLCDGCRVIEYTDGKGRSLKVTNYFFDTKIGKATAHSGDGDEMTIENYDSESQAIQAVRDAIGKIPSN